MASEELRNRVRRLRFENGEMTQRQLAEEVGVTRQTIIAIEANRYSPSLKLAFRIARAFGVSIEDVFQCSHPSADPVTEKREKPSTARG
jgi:putative transcriptional regulator